MKLPHVAAAVVLALPADVAAWTAAPSLLQQHQSCSKGRSWVVQQTTCRLIASAAADDGVVADADDAAAAPAVQASATDKPRSSFQIALPKPIGLYLDELVSTVHAVPYRTHCRRSELAPQRVQWRTAAAQRALRAQVRCTRRVPALLCRVSAMAQWRGTHAPP
jgi:hypothetical protein